MQRSKLHLYQLFCILEDFGFLQVNTILSHNQLEAVPTNSSEARDKGIKRKMHNEDIEAKRPKKGVNVKEKPKELLKPKLPAEKNPKTTVFVSNMLPGVSEDKLQTVFPNAAAVEIARDRKGKSRCFGYVEFKTEEEVIR